MQTNNSKTPARERANSYFFVSHWRVRGRVEEVFRLFQQVERLPDWWPSVYLSVSPIEGGDSRSVALKTKGWLPYTIHWQMSVTGLEFPKRIDLRANGDLEGRGTWLLAQDGDDVDITFEWEVLANKPLLKWFSPLLKPLFGMNHHWAMKQGEISLKLEMQRMQARSMEEALKVPLPPGPESPAKTIALIGGAAGLLLALAWLARKKNSP